MSTASQRWIILLLALNILLTVTVLLRQESADGMANERVSNSLPEEIAVPYARRVVDAYNSNNPDRLYELYHEDARSKLTRPEVADQLQRLQSLFGSIQSVSYLNNLRLGEQGGEQYYQVHFSVRVDNPKLDKAQLVLHLIRDNDGVALYGMRLNAAQP